MFGIDIPIVDDLLELGGTLQGQDFMSDEATTARNHSAEQAQVNRDFQERMRATQYTTAVQDMKNAGLNPMLAYQQGGAGTPGGMGTASPAAGGPARYSPATAAQIRQVEAQTENIKADTQNKLDENPNIRGIQGIQNQTVALLRQQAETLMSQEHLNDEQRKLVHQEIKNAVEENRRIHATTGNIKVDTVLKELDVPKARNEAEAESSAFKKNVSPYLGDVNRITNSAGDLIRRRR